MPDDFVDELLADAGEPAARQQVSGGHMDDESAMIEDFQSEIGALVSVGALDEVGAAKLQRVARGMVANLKAALHPGGRKPLPSPPFERSARDTERRAPLGFVEDGTGNNFWALPAVLNSRTVMRGKVSRVAHVNRLLIVPSAPGVVIESIKVGDEEQTLASGVPVELYGTTALTDTEPDNFSPLGPALDFAVTFKNTTAGAITGTIGCKAACKR